METSSTDNSFLASLARWCNLSSTALAPTERTQRNEVGGSATANRAFIIYRSITSERWAWGAIKLLWVMFSCLAFTTGAASIIKIKEFSWEVFGWGGKSLLYLDLQVCSTHVLDSRFVLETSIVLFAELFKPDFHLISWESLQSTNLTESAQREVNLSGC